MNLLISAATAFEIRPFLEKLPLVRKTGDNLSCHQFRNITIDVLVPGVGMVATAYFLGRQLAARRYDLAINAGIAGAYDPSLPLGSVVQVMEDCVPDLGAEDGENFLTAFDLGLIDPELPPYRGGRLVNDREASIPRLYSGKLARLPRVRGITSNTVHGNMKSIQDIRRLRIADVESMEGAAFFYGCMTEGVPCLQIRSISNRVEERNRSAWELDLALKNLNRFLMELLADIA